MKPLRMSLLLSLFIVLFGIALQAQVPYEYTSNPGSAITDFTTTTSSITITDVFKITDLNVLVDIEHDFAADLTITISHSGGPTVVLSANNGGSYDNYMNTIFDDEAAGYINGGSIVGTPGAGFNGLYVPQNPLSVYNGASGAGTWTISVTDGALLNEGKLKRWGLIFNRVPSGSSYQPYKDIRVGWDLNYWGNTRYYNTPGPGYPFIDPVQAWPPFTVLGLRPSGGWTSGYVLWQNSAIASATNIHGKSQDASGNTTGEILYDIPASAASDYYTNFTVPLTGAIGNFKFTFTLFQRYGLFMANNDDQIIVNMPVTPGSLAWDNGVMQSFFNYTAPECDAVTMPIYATQLLTSIDIYQGYAVELAPGVGAVDVNVWDANTGTPGAVLGTSTVHTLPPQGTKWVTYPFNPPVSLPSGNYGFGMCVTTNPGIGGVALGLDNITSQDPLYGRYEGLMVQWYNLTGTWFEEIAIFTNKMIRPNFLTGVDLGVYTIDSPNGSVGGPQAVQVTFKRYDHVMNLLNVVATGRVTIKNSGGAVVYTSERRITLAPYGTSVMSFDTFTPTATGDYTITALIDRINTSDDEDLLNNSYTRTFTILNLATPVIVSEDGSLNNDQRGNIIKAMRAKGLEVQFQNRTIDGNPLDNATQVIWVGDVNMIDDAAVRSFIDKGNYFSVLSQKAISHLGDQLLNKVRPASEIAYELYAANKLSQAQAADAMRHRTTGAQPSGNKNNVSPMSLSDDFMAGLADERMKNFESNLQSAGKKLEEEGPAPKWHLEANGIIPGRGTISSQREGSIKVRESLLGDLQFAEVLTNRNFNVPSVESKPLPTEFALEQNYPNPFNPSTNIAYTLPTESRMTIHIYDVLGRKVATLFEGIQNQGRYMMTWDGEGSYNAPLASGVYFYRLEAAPTNGSTPFSASKKMVLAR